MNDILLLKEIKAKLKYNNFFKGIFTLAIIIVLSFLIMSVTFAFSSAPLNVSLFKSYFTEKLVMLMNFIPIFLCMSFIYLIFNRLWIGYFLTSLILVTMSIVNKFKLMYRDDPFSFIDLRLIKESMIMAKKYDLTLSYRIIVLIITLIGIAIILKIFFKYEIASKKTRIMLLLILTFISILIFKDFYFNPNIYKTVGDKKLINIWVQSDQFKSKGFIYPFIYSIKEAKEVELEGYDEQKAIEDLSAYDYSDIPSKEKVNIISIMLEAYNDFSEFESIDLGIDIYENFHKIKNESISGKLVTNIFAGGTVDTERAFLTGYYTHPKYFRKTNSFVWYLNEQGYRTEAMHPITGSFYNRRNINEYLGFHSFDHFDNKYKNIQETYLEDMDFFDYIIEGYQNSKANKQPYFNFSVTYQNHGPYSTEKYSEKEYLKKESYYDDGMYNIINNYLAGISKTDKALKKIIDYFRNEEEPTIIIIFGDHNPWLGENRVVYDMMGIDLDLATVEGFKNYYEIPYIIYGNNEAKKLFNKDFIGKGNDISPHFLMAELFQYIGWEGNEYMQYILNIKDKFDVTHKLYFKENGQYKKELSTENKKFWKNFLNVEHYYSHNFKK